MEVLTFKEIQLIDSIYILITFYSEFMEIKFCYFKCIYRRIGMLYTQKQESFLDKEWHLNLEICLKILNWEIRLA